MGFEIAEAIANHGGEVILISGPSRLRTNHPNIRSYFAENADQMYHLALEHFSDVDVAIMAAAVADYRPKEIQASKIKKSDKSLTIQLEPTQDILASLGKIKDHQLLIGFALETDNELENARKKLKRKKADLIVLNSLKDEGAGFDVDTNKVYLVEKDSHTELKLMPKSEVAQKIVEKIKKML
jgi:phosphopantothenoylcysteine decarboxylase/phosphopantothenate--cysteine ligase